MGRTSPRSRTSHPAPLRHVIVVNVSDYYGRPPLDCLIGRCSGRSCDLSGCVTAIRNRVSLVSMLTLNRFRLGSNLTPSTQQRSAAPLDITGYLVVPVDHVTLQSHLIACLLQWLATVQADAYPGITTPRGLQY